MGGGEREEGGAAMLLLLLLLPLLSPFKPAAWVLKREVVEGRRGRKKRIKPYRERRGRRKRKKNGGERGRKEGLCLLGMPNSRTTFASYYFLSLCVHILELEEERRSEIPRTRI